MRILDNYVVPFWTEAIFCVTLLYMISRAKKGATLPEINRLPGLDALDEAIGRCTEMGRALLYTPGIEGLNVAQTMAALSILGYVVKQCAKYDTSFIMPNTSVPVFAVAEGIVKQSFTEAGKADVVRPDMVRFIAEDQFALAAGIIGIMHREKPAANVMFGSFYAESLILAESGSMLGAIQIAGTANTHQIPFFVAACDYALIGEELYAASAYLTREPVLLASIIVQDWGKYFAAAVALAGALLITANSDVIVRLLAK